MKKRPRDINQLGKLMVDISTGQVQDTEQVSSDEAKDDAEEPPPVPPLWIRREEVMGNPSDIETTSETAT